MDEVAWIVPEIYIKTGRKKEIRPGDLLTYDEFEMFMDGVARVSKYVVRDKAMTMCMYEGAFRPGELLQMTIGLVFKDKIAVITTTGKTGEKTVPLLLSYKPLQSCYCSSHLYMLDTNMNNALSAINASFSSLRFHK